MDSRVAFNLFGKDIYWYGIIIAAALIIGVILGVLEAKRRGFRSEMVLDFMLLAIPIGIVCARLYYVVFEWENYAGDLLRIIAVWEGGMAIYGAVIGGIIAAIIFNRWRRVYIGDMLDIAAPSLIISQAIGRWGNFVNQEAHGGLITDPNWQWFPAGVQINGEWFQATFFYESLWNVLVFIALMAVRKKIKVRGGVFALYVALYGLGRFWIEALRTDSLMINEIRVSQWLSAVLFVLGLAYFIIMTVRKAEVKPYDGYYSLSWTQDQLNEYKANSRLFKAQHDAARAEEKADELKEKYDEQLKKVVKAQARADKAKKKLEKIQERKAVNEFEAQEAEADIAETVDSEPAENDIAETEEKDDSKE